MKSSRTMYDLAYDDAVHHGFRRFGEKAGYCLTIKELTMIFFREGFNPDRSGMRRYIAQWEGFDLVTTDETGGVYWFSLRYEDARRTKEMAKEMGIPETDIVGLCDDE